MQYLFKLHRLDINGQPIINMGVFVMVCDNNEYIHSGGKSVKAEELVEGQEVLLGNYIGNPHFYTILRREELCTNMAINVNGYF
jgi:hypothetical protein